VGLVGHGGGSEWVADYPAWGGAVKCLVEVGLDFGYSTRG